MVFIFEHVVLFLRGLEIPYGVLRAILLRLQVLDLQLDLLVHAVDLDDQIGPLDFQRSVLFVRVVAHRRHRLLFVLYQVIDEWRERHCLLLVL